VNVNTLIQQRIHYAKETMGVSANMNRNIG
jgi:hypothetical protein